MDAEKIDAILMDYALGAWCEAQEDVAALVKAYVEKDAAAARRLAEWRRIAGRAQGAMCGDAIVLPAFPRAAVKQSVRRQQWRRGLMWGAGMAACIAAGFVLGQGRQKAVPVVAQASAEPVSEGLSIANDPPEQRVAAVKEFWSMSRLRAYAQESRSTASTKGPAESWRGAWKNFSW